jgi:small-conductance mechanosensitive channel
MGDLLQGFANRVLGGTSTTSALERLGQAGGTFLLALLVAAIAFYVAARIRQSIYRFFATRGDLGMGILLGRTAYFLVLFIGLLFVLSIFGLSPATLLTTLGVVGLAVSLALQDVLKNVFAGIYLLIERPFQPGETIKVRDFVGTVETIELRTTTLSADGEIIHVPNAILFSEVLVNRGTAAKTVTSGSRNVTAEAPSEDVKRKT